MKFCSRVFPLLFSLLILTGLVRAQSYTDTIAQRMEWHAAKKSSPVLFAHIDKSVYINNETIWFTAYLLGAGKNLAAHQIISASLVNNNNQRIAIQSKFPMSGGTAYGNLMVPDTVPPGNYTLTFLTNVILDGKPAARFTQALTIKSATESSFNVELTLDTLYKDAVNTRVLLSAKSSNSPLDGATINYFLGKNSDTRIVGEAKTNVIGSYTLLIPKDRINPAQHNLEVQVKSGGEVKTLHLDLPVKQQINDVRFYPEGGYMITGLPNKVSWEVKTSAGTPIRASAQLLADGKVVAGIETDAYGMGRFNLTPLPNGNYTVKLLQVKNDNSIYSLPLALQNGLVVQIDNAIVNDTITAKLRSNLPGKFTMVIHNYKQVFSATEVDVNRAGRSVTVDLSEIPRGLSIITMLDALNRPVAEHTFFAHYDHRPIIGISVDKTEPGNRQKVNIKLKLTGANGKKTNGLVSVACVEDSRFELKKGNNIENYVYLQNELDNLPAKDNLMGATELDRKYLNDVLLVRGWSKYNWPEMMKTPATDTVKNYNSLVFRGDVTHFGDSLKKAVVLITIKDTSKIWVMNSTDKGYFSLTNTDVYGAFDRSIRMIVSGKSDQYTIRLNDPYVDLQKGIAKTIEPVLFDPVISQTSAEFKLTGLEHITKLREVKIRPPGVGPAVNANACGDFVCRFGYLNCPNHRTDYGNRPAVKGEQVNLPNNGGTATYLDCNDDAIKPGMIAFKGVYAAKEFYINNYTGITASEPDYQSTIFWRHVVKLSSDKETELSFYTSDVTGKFRIVVQGITNEDAVYSTTDFEVKKKTP